MGYHPETLVFSFPPYPRGDSRGDEHVFRAEDMRRQMSEDLERVEMREVTPE